MKVLVNGKIVEKELNNKREFPERPLTEIDFLQQQITDLQLAMTELYEGGQANG